MSFLRFYHSLLAKSHVTQTALAVHKTVRGQFVFTKRRMAVASFPLPSRLCKGMESEKVLAQITKTASKGMTNSRLHPFKKAIHTARHNSSNMSAATIGTMLQVWCR